MIPRVANVSCYMSRADTGGIKGGLGLAEDPSRFSIACRAVGPIAVPPGLPKSEVIAFASASLFFKTFQIHRAIDAEKNVLVYTVVSTKLINGSPFNSISVSEGKLCESRSRPESVSNFFSRRLRRPSGTSRPSWRTSASQARRQSRRMEGEMQAVGQALQRGQDELATERGCRQKVEQERDDAIAASPPGGRGAAA